MNRVVTDAREIAVKLTKARADWLISLPQSFTYWDWFVALVGEAVWNDADEPDAVDCATSILSALAKRGGKIVFNEEQN